MKRMYNLILLGLLLVTGGFIVVKNSLDENDISGLNRDVEALYKDRLMAANYIYRMNDLLHKKRGFYADAVQAGKETIETPLFQKELKEVITLYSGTKLTTGEEKAFRRFRGLTEGLYLSGKTSQLTSAQAWGKIVTIDRALDDLRLLSDIQVKEATVLKSRSGDVLGRALLALRLEWVLLIVIVLLFISFLRDRVLLPSNVPIIQRN